jgi:uncharacterized protein (TIGR02284 family)
MTATNQQIEAALNALVVINNDRIQGYEKAVEDTDDQQLDDLFRQMIIQSQNFRAQLADHIVHIDGTGVSDATTTDVASKIHRAWIDIKAAVTGKNRDTVLSSVEFGEGAALEAYKMALENGHLPAYIQEDLMKQMTLLEDAQANIKALQTA